MFQFVRKVTLPTNSPKTYAELIVAAIESRTYTSVQERSEAANRFRQGLLPTEAFVTNRTDVDVYEQDAWKGVRNGVADASAFTLPGDMTNGVTIIGGESKHYIPKVNLDALIVYQNSGASIELELTIIVN